VDVVYTAESSGQPQVVKETTFILREPTLEVSVHDELDAFYARLAKIQLEKHQLAEALSLVRKIRSEIFKVRTIVNLAEFVSRDKNYRDEAEQLYRLALEGMEALDNNQPFRIGMSDAQPVPLLLDSIPPDDDATVLNGSGRLPPPPPPVDFTEEPVPAPPARTQQEDNGLVPLVPQTPAESGEETPPTLKPRPTITLDEDDEPEAVVPSSPEPKVETPTQQPHRSRPVPTIVLEEN
jgi:uncharacterized protein (UPF0335 family)